MGVDSQCCNCKQDERITTNFEKEIIENKCNYTNNNNELDDENPMLKTNKSNININNSINNTENNNPFQISNLKQGSNGFQNKSNNIFDYLNEDSSNKVLKTFVKKKITGLNSSNQLSNSIKYAKEPALIKIQSIYKAYFYRKKFKNIKKELINEEKEIIEKLTDSYRKQNLIKAEHLYGEFDKNGWISFYQNESIENSNVKTILNFCYGSVFHTNLLKLDKIVPSFYVGEVNNENHLHGYGVILKEDGTKMEGHFNNNIFTGWGRIIDSEGTLFEGLFINGKLNGKGIKKNLNGNVYIGDFIDNLKDGNGKEETNELIYEGMYKNDKKNGNGKLQYKTLQDYYEGEFLDDCITGYGCYRWANKDMYNGTFLNGKMHGKGSYKWPDGGEYIGDYINNIKEGNGVFKWSNGRTYVGQFKKGRPCGKGILKTENRELEVEFKEGKLKTNIKDVLQKKLNGENNKNNDAEGGNMINMNSKDILDKMNNSSMDDSDENRGNNVNSNGENNAYNDGHKLSENSDNDSGY